MKLSMLKKMKKEMPMKKGMEEEMEGMEMPEMESEYGDEMASSEMESKEGMESEMPAEGSMVLESASDEELMAELKKRGLMSQMSESESEDSESVI
jgi:hypothetical protein